MTTTATAIAITATATGISAANAEPRRQPPALRPPPFVGGPTATLVITEALVDPAAQRWAPIPSTTSRGSPPHPRSSSAVDERRPWTPQDGDVLGAQKQPPRPFGVAAAIPPDVARSSSAKRSNPTFAQRLQTTPNRLPTTAVPHQQFRNPAPAISDHRNHSTSEPSRPHHGSRSPSRPHRRSRSLSRPHRRRRSLSRPPERTAHHPAAARTRTHSTVSGKGSRAPPRTRTHLTATRTPRPPTRANRPPSRSRPYPDSPAKKATCTPQPPTTRSHPHPTTARTPQPPTKKEAQP
jgi:hypothetical protein